MKENCHSLKKAKKQMIYHRNYHELRWVLFTNIPAQAESLSHTLEQGARGIVLYVNVDKTELMSFKLLNCKPLKLLDQFIYFGSNISSTENDVNIRKGKTWITVEWISGLSENIKWEFFHAEAMSVLIYGCTTRTLMKLWGKKVKWELKRNIPYCFKQILEAAPHKIAATRWLTSHLTNHSNKMNMKSWSLLEKQVTLSCELLYMDTPVLADRQKLTSALCGHLIPFIGTAKSDGR